MATMNETIILLFSNLIRHAKNPAADQVTFRYCRDNCVNTIEHTLDGTFLDYWPTRTYDLFEVGFHLRFSPLAIPKEEQTHE